MLNGFVVDVDGFIIREQTVTAAVVISIFTAEYITHFLGLALLIFIFEMIFVILFQYQVIEHHKIEEDFLAIYEYQLWIIYFLIRFIVKIPKSKE